MSALPGPPYPPGHTVFDSSDVALVEVSDADGTMIVGGEGPPLTAEALLQLMRERVKYYGSPLPEGFVPPPGIDIDALLKQVPWPPTDPDAPPRA